MKKLIVVVLALLVLVPAAQAAEISYNQIAWWGEIWQNDTSDGTDHNSWPGGMSVWRRWGALNRGFIGCNWAGNMTDPGVTFGIYNNLVSANLQMDMTAADTNLGLPGIKVRWIYQAETNWGGNYTVPDDWSAPVAMDLGWLVAPGDSTLGVKTIDITAALQQASDEFVTSGGVRPYFYLQLIVGDDDGVVGSAPESYYVFNTSGANPPGTGFNMTLSDTNPIPEPSVMTLGLVALLGLWRKK